jgi:MurNAc alpha-1-phosphate uridylyltransferase
MPMRALIFAAGRGERMRPLTDFTPKPLIKARGKRLIEWHLEGLARAGVSEVVINTSHLAEQFPAALGDGSRWGLRIAYSYEGPQALETGGGMLRALDLLGADPFIVVNGDVWCEYDFSKLPAAPAALAHLVMVDNPPQHPRGDFVLNARGLLHMPTLDGPRTLTYAGIGVYSPQLLDGSVPGAFRLAPLLIDAINRGEITGERFDGGWSDVGTPERLRDLEDLATSR